MSIIEKGRFYKALLKGCIKSLRVIFPVPWGELSGSCFWLLIPRCLLRGYSFVSCFF